jgi:polyhydroxybutyrate depolymerase
MRPKLDLRCVAAIALLATAGTGVAQQNVPVFAGRGPVTLHVPPQYSPQNPTPLVVIIHGYGSNADMLERYINFTPLADEQDFLLVFPNGLFDQLDNRYWNGTDACCGPDSDDSGYLRALIGNISGKFNVDARRIFVFGHSNGGYMAHRMGCDTADIIAAFASLSGATWLDQSNCVPAGPVQALEIHGTEDDRVYYDGGCWGDDHCFPSAQETIQDWASLNHCGTAETSPLLLDLTADIDGLDTVKTNYNGCDAGGSAALWTIVGGRHHPELSDSFSDTVIRYLLSHPKPSDIACEEVVSLRTGCEVNTSLAVDLALSSSAHDGTTVDIEVDDTLKIVTVRGSHAKVLLPGQWRGDHTVRLVEPHACRADIKVTCGQ